LYLRLDHERGPHFRQPPNNPVSQGH
jgi:hypothetical protein